MTKLIRWPDDAQKYHPFVAKFLSYNSDTGDLIWLAGRARVKAGDVAGNISASTGYIQVELAQKNCAGHHLAWLLFYGEWPSTSIDHINHNRSDNRIANLRLADQQENMRNIGIRRDNVSGITGVSWCKARCKWTARIKDSARGSYKFLGRFESRAEAALARSIAERKYGYHENHGKRHA